MELCGHATLASAHLLWELGEAPEDQPITFHTRFRGALGCTREAAWSNDEDGAASGDASGGGGAIAMDFPADPPRDAKPPKGLIQALGTPRVIHVARATYDWIIELATEAEVRRIEPDLEAIARFDCRGVAVTARARPGRPYDIAARLFAPRLRVAEDPVTGSLYCALGPYWQPRLGKQRLAAYQASPRGGRLDVQPHGERVTLVGSAVTVIRGELLAPIT